MPIQLDVPFNPGDIDPGQSYPIAKIKHVGIDLVGKMIVVTYTYGDEVSGVFTKGRCAPERVVALGGSDYDQMVSSEIDESCSGIIYEGVKKELYDYLLDSGLVEGEIV